MAASCVKIAISQAILLRSSTRILPLATQVRRSQYDTHHQKPIIEKSTLYEPLPDSDIRKYKPIKAAKNEQTTSVFYNSILEKFTNIVMKKGQKTLARGIVQGMLENIKQIQVEKYNRAETPEEKANIECNPEFIFEQAIINLKPVLILTTINKGGVAYKVPIACTEYHQQFRAMKWVVESCRDKERKLPMEKKLAMEILDAFRNEGKCIRKKQDLMRQCEANRAFAHFRW